MSLDLRFYFMVLNEIVMKTSGWKLAFVTVNFSKAMTEKVAREAARAPATYYADLVNKRLRKHGVCAQWFGVLEDHRGNLHSHCLVAYHQDDEPALKACFGLDTDLANSGYRLQHRYKQRWNAMTKSSLQQQLFTLTDGYGSYRQVPVDIGSADYISKALEKRSRYMDPGKCRIYAGQTIRREAKDRYRSARDKQQRLKSNKGDLTLHQSMTYLYRGWIPVIDDDNGQRYEQQASEIDEVLAWDGFRNSSPAYDWQYEAGDAEPDDSLNADTFMAAETSERDYEQTVLEAEAAWDNEHQSIEPSEREYDWTVSEAALLTRQQRKARQPTEREHDRLMLEIDVFIEQQRNMSPAPDEIGADVSDDQVIALIRQEGRAELYQLIDEHAAQLLAELPFALHLSKNTGSGDVTKCSVLTRSPATQPSEDHRAIVDISDESITPPSALPGTRQNVQERPCERRRRRKSATPCADAETRYRRAQGRIAVASGYPSSVRVRRIDMNRHPGAAQLSSPAPRREWKHRAAQQRFRFDDTG